MLKKMLWGHIAHLLASHSQSSRMDLWGRRCDSCKSLPGVRKEFGNILDSLLRTSHLFGSLP